VIAADRGRQFGWLVGDHYVRWLYSMQAEGTGTRLTEAWEFLPNGIQLFQDRYGDDAPNQIAVRTDLAHRGISATLAAMKRIAEAERVG
jgi:hypothetical protein